MGDPQAVRSASGKVFLVGGGPGDPGLLTIKGQRLLRQADVVVYDFLVDPQLLSEAPQAELIAVGNPHGHDRIDQKAVNALLVHLAHEGKTVVRLKGGDPYLFGRGGEEGLELHAAGVAFEVVPGVSAALAVPAYAGIPVTHRDFTNSLAIFTGQERPDKVPAAAWRSWAGGNGTLVFLMAIENLDRIVAGVLEAGRPGTTPAAAIQWGTRPQQRTVVAPLADLPTRVRQAGLRAPGVVIVGEVVGLRDRLAWFERLPLFGRGILVTRASHQAAGLSAGLRELGGMVYEVPLIELLPPASWAGVDAALVRLHTYDWLVFTSANGVKRWWARLQAGGRDARALAGAKICAIGPETAAALAGLGLTADVVPPDYVAEALVAALPPNLAGLRILIPRATVARDILPDLLRQAGAEVDVVEVYSTQPPSGAARALAQTLGQHQIDVLTFASSSTVDNFVALGGTVPAGAAVACIGPITAATAQAAGLPVQIVAQTYTSAGLLEAVAAHFGGSIDHDGQALPTPGAAAS